MSASLINRPAATQLQAQPARRRRDIAMSAALGLLALAVVVNVAVIAFLNFG